jgi:hypothetical protein
MDATWFAVDRDGHVGVFASGEPGAVPREVEASIGPDDDAVRSALEPLPELGEPELKLNAVFHPGLRPGVLPRPRRLARGWPEGEATLLILRDESALTPQVRALPGLDLSRVGDYVLLSLKPEIALAQQDPQWIVWDEFKRAMAAEPTYITSLTVFDGYYSSELSLARRGLFAYRAHARINIAEPYGQVFAPREPLRLDSAPGAVRDVLATRARLDVSFSSSPYVQPVGLIPCAVWGEPAAYLAADGFTVRPFPGVDARAYAKEAAGLRSAGSPGDESLYKPLTFDPPLDDESR